MALLVPGPERRLARMPWVLMVAVCFSLALGSGVGVGVGD